jgi:hypothetical protein
MTTEDFTPKNPQDIFLIDRDSASALNPMIRGSTVETIETVANLQYVIGTLFDEIAENGRYVVGDLSLLSEAMQAALKFEVANLKAGVQPMADNHTADT